MIRPAADETTTRAAPEMGVRWANKARHASQMDRLRMRGEELVVAAPARPSGRDGVMASPPPPQRRWLLEGAGAAFQHVLTAFTVTYDQSEHCPIRLRAWDDSQAIGGGPRDRTRLQCKVIAYMNVCVSFPLINSHGVRGLYSTHVDSALQTAVHCCTMSMMRSIIHQAHTV